MKFSKKIAATLLGIICAGCVAGGLTACKAKGPTGTPDNATTYRLALPNDGSAPTAHTGLENIGYMAYALDKEDYYHVYAHCASKAMGYTQITQSWKDYKDGIMIASDLTYSSLVKAGTQACFINNEVYMRTSETPGKSTTSTSANWRTTKPTYYDRDKYLTTYGEFSTELCTYIINEETIKSYGEVVVNEDGTYTQSFTLNSKAASYYQYGMKTRGDLKGYPVFNSIDITFTFDGNWTVLSSYCEEKSSIAPNSLGGIPMDSTSKITTTFGYGESDFDNEHFGYYDSYYKQYIGKVDDGGSGGGTTDNTPDLMAVLANGFGSVIAGGEQFNLDLKVGQTEYDGKIYLSLASLEDVLGSIDARIALGKEGRQDLYLDFAGGTVNAYYSDDFAMTLNIDAVSTIISQFKEWASNFSMPEGASAVSYALTGDEEEQSEGGFDISSLLSMLKMEYDDTTVKLSVETDDLLGTGIGVKLYLNFDRGDGNTYIFKNIELESIAYDSTSIDLHATITPDKDGEVISHNKNDAPANLADYASGVYSMLDSDTLKVTLDFDGSKQEAISMLQGLSVNAEAYVELGYDLASRVDLDIEYSGLTAELAVYYGNNIDFKSAGKVYLDLVKVNGEDIGAKVYCDIDKTVDAVKNLLDLINNNVATANLTAVQSEQAASSVANIINGILNLNFGEVLGDLYASNSQIRVNANVDMIIDALGVNVNGIKFGTAALALGLNDGKSNLSLKLDALGLNMTVEGSEGDVTLPDKSEYYDATGLVELVSVAVKESKYIIEAKAIAFDIDALVIVDDVPMQVIGSGEVSWANGLKVAVNADMTIADGTSAAGKDKVALQLLYNQSAEEGEPFVKFAVNGLGMEIYDKDLTETQNGIQKIIDSINLLINGEKSGNATAETAAELYNTSVQLDGGNIGDAVAEVVESDNVQKILGAVLGFVKDLTVSTDYDINDGSVSKLIISHALYGGITLTADGGLSLEADIKNANETQIAKLSAGVKTGDGTAFESVTSALENCTMYSTAETEDAFVKIVYNYLFAVVEKGLSVSQTLGSNTYEVAIHLDGANSDIPAINNVSVDATLYYTQGLVGDKIKGDKLAEIDLVLNIGSTTAQVNVRYNDEKIYISVDKIGTTNLNEVKFYASKDDISSAVEELVRLITDENVIKTLSKLVNPTAANTVAEKSAVAPQADGSALSGLLEKLLTFNFANAVSLSKVDGVNTATVNVDSLLDLFGVNTGFEIGTAKIGVNPKTHAVSGSVNVNGKDWITLSAEKAARPIYADNWQAEYINAGFIPTMISDLYKTVTNDNGEFYTLYTFSGKIDIAVKITVLGIPINTTIKLDVTSLTVGLDENGEFYLTVLANLQENKITNSIKLAEGNNVSITYSKNYVTLGKGVGTDGAVYKVMSLNYLLQNVFAKHSGNVDSPLRWLLGMTDNVWNIIAGAVPSLGSSGTPTYTLYDSLAQASTGDGSFYLTQFVKSIGVMVNGGMVTDFGDGAAVANALGFTGDNYYALQINAKKLTGVLNSLYVGLTRSDEKGINGIKAIGSLSASPAEIKFTLDLNQYKEGVTELYQSGPITGDYAAPNYFEVVDSAYEIEFDREFTSNDTHIVPVFGCFTTPTADNPNVVYESVNTYSKVTLTIEYGDLLAAAYEQLGLTMNEDGVYFKADDISYSSIVYLRTPFAPTWVNDGHTYAVIYTTDKEGNNRITDVDGGRVYMQIYDDTTIYAQVEETVMINFVTGVDGVDTVSGGFVADAQLIGYNIEGYTFLGWYADSNFTQKVENANNGNIATVDGVKTVYGKYVVSQITVNGVVYAYTDNAYEVKTFDEYGIKQYTESGSTLVLESEVNGYPVTAIAKHAFEKSMVKNVVVPASITTVGASAFQDNHKIESVVFLADTVRFAGTSASGDDRYPFYGCSTVDDGTETLLRIYYNTATYDNSNWNLFRNKSNKNYHVGIFGGGLYPNGTWSYVNVEFSGNEISSLNCIASGIRTDAMTSQDIINAAVAELKAKTAEENKCINAYNVSVSGGFTKDAKVHNINITITKSTPYYLVTTDVEGAVVSGTEEVYNGKVYVKAGTQVTVAPPAGYGFTSLEGVDGLTADGSNYKFTMPAQVVELQGETEWVGLGGITIHSAIDYTYDNNVVKLANEDYYISGVSETDILGTITATNNDYYFVGWACPVGNTLKFTGTTVGRNSDFYAIWAYGREEINSVSTVTEGTDPNAATVTVNSSKASGFYKWYSDEDFNTEVNAISIDKTVLHARLKFSLIVNVYASATKMYTTIDGDKQTVATIDNNNNQTKTMSTLDVIEGYDVTVIVGDDYSTCALSITGESLITYSGIKRKSTFGFWGDDAGTLRYFNKGGKTVDMNEVAVAASDTKGTIYNDKANGNMTLVFNM